MVSTTYQIKDVAERSGFTAATLRYYEQIGLLPESNRTPAGYRLYDDHTLERPAFISRAKQLGCSLEEVSDLASAWDAGRCGPVQDRLRAVVADKLATAQQQIVELTTLTVELHRAAATLAGDRPDGPCDDTCGCITDQSMPGEVSSRAVTIGVKPSDVSTEPIVCTLGTQSMRGRLDEWQRLLEHVEQRESMSDGLRVTFGPMAPLAEVSRLAAAEQDCCQFFAFAITIDGRGVALEIRAADDALPVLHSLFGAAA